jgi:hypothetical protein
VEEKAKKKRPIITPRITKYRCTTHFYWLAILVMPVVCLSEWRFNRDGDDIAVAEPYYSTRRLPDFTHTALMNNFETLTSQKLYKFI